MQNKHHIGRWELSCVVFNTLIYKIFTSFPETYAESGGSAAWLSALLSGAIFLLLLIFLIAISGKIFEKGLILTVHERFGKSASKIVAILGGIYFSFSLGYTFYLICDALRNTVYVNTPIWFIALFFSLAAIITAVYGSRSVFRMHSLCVLGIVFSILLITVMSLKYADIYNLTPVFGKGLRSIFSGSAFALTMYSDIFIIFFLPAHEEKYSFKKTVLLSAAAAVLINTLAVTAFSLNVPFDIAEKISYPLYPLTKSANIGKFPIRLDLFYQTAFLFSAYLHISLLLNTVIRCTRQFNLSAKKAGSVLACILLSLTLCGCYDGSEIEEQAYIIALGIDKGENTAYKYTFQISNPLESGTSTGSEKEAKDDSAEKDSNKTVNNITIEADNYYLAGNKLKSVLSKDFDISHIKLIVFSFDAASDDALAHSELLLREREVRPSTNVCLTKSAEEFLNNVKPTLEVSTVRYYELFFGNHNSPLAPITELRDFVGRGADTAYDAVMPIADETSLAGIGIFNNGVLKENLSSDDALIYRLLCGELENAAYGGSVISSNKKTDTNVKKDGESLDIKITAYVTVEITDGNYHIGDELAKHCEDFLYRCSFHSSDVLGVGRHIKADCKTIREWTKTDYEKIFPMSRFTVEIVPSFSKNTKILAY